MNNEPQIELAGSRYFAEQDKRQASPPRQWTERAPLLLFSGVELPVLCRPTPWWRKQATLFHALVLAGALLGVLLVVAVLQ